MAVWLLRRDVRSAAACTHEIPIHQPPSIINHSNSRQQTSYPNTHRQDIQHGCGMGAHQQSGLAGWLAGWLACASMNALSTSSRSFFCFFFFLPASAAPGQ